MDANWPLPKTACLPSKLRESERARRTQVSRRGDQLAADASMGKGSKGRRNEPRQENVGPLSDTSRFPAMRMLLQKADEENANKDTKRLIQQTLERERQDRFNCLAHAEWKGRTTGSIEHLQGRSNNMTYHYMFELEDQQPTERVEGFLALYRTSEQKLDDIVALLPLPKSNVQACLVLVRLVYMICYIRSVVQTENGIGLFDKAAYGDVIDESFDRTVEYISTAAKRDAEPMPMVNIALPVSHALHKMVEEVRAKFPAVAEPGAGLARDVPLMRHLELLAQVAEKQGAGMVIPSREELIKIGDAHRAQVAAGGHGPLHGEMSVSEALSKLSTTELT